MTVKDFLDSLDPNYRSVALTYVPILSRWAADAGWEAVRKALYVQEQQGWYRAMRKRMTPGERQADDRRARDALNRMAVEKQAIIAQDRALLQAIMTLLISAMLAKL